MSDFDFHATVSRLFVYPVKSCAGIEVKEAVVTETGLELDRAWMVVDESGEFVSQRELPRMALIRPQIRQYELILRAPGMLALHIAIDAVEKPCSVRVWDDTCLAYDMGDVASQWFTDFLLTSRPNSFPNSKLRLVRFDPDFKRQCSPKWTKGLVALNQFSDGFPLLVVSESALDELNCRLAKTGQAPVSMARFRPNIVLSGLQAHDEDHTQTIQISGADTTYELQLVKPCSRCSIPDIDPLDALSDQRVSHALLNYRQDARLGGAISFGMNAIVARDDAPFDLPIAVGFQALGSLQF